MSYQSREPWRNDLIDQIFASFGDDPRITDLEFRIAIVEALARVMIGVHRFNHHPSKMFDPLGSERTERLLDEIKDLLTERLAD